MFPATYESRSCRASFLNENTQAMDPAEVEFLAEKEVVSIVPNFTLEEIYMIGVSESRDTDTRCANFV